MYLIAGLLILLVRVSVLAWLISFARQVGSNWSLTLSSLVVTRGYAIWGHALTVLLAMTTLLLSFIPDFWLVGVWSVVAFITLLDTFLVPWRLRNSPLAEIDDLSLRAGKKLKSGDIKEFCQDIDGLSDIYSRGIALGTPTPLLRSLEAMGTITTATFQKLSSETLQPVDEFAPSFLLERLAFMQEKAFAQNIDAAIRQFLTIYGKLAIAGAAGDPILSQEAIERLLGVASRAQKLQRTDLVVRTQLTLIEVTRAIVAAGPKETQDLKPVLFKIFAGAENLAKEAFRNDKSTPMAVLTQPFRDLKEICSAPQLSGHPDQNILLSDLGRIILELDTLDLVMRTKPSPSTIINQAQQGLPPNP